MSSLQALCRKAVVAVSLLPVISSAVYAVEAVPASVAAQSANSVVVARVNGAAITARQLKQATDALIATQPDAKLSPEALKKVNINMLDRLVSQELLYQSALKMGTPDLDKVTKEAVAKGKAGFASEAEFQKALLTMGMTEKEVEDNARRGLVIANFVAKQIDAKISVSDEDCKIVYKENLSQFTQPEKVRLSHILIATPAEMNDAEKKEARQTAEGVRKELLNGVSFVELAKKHSADLSNKLGGDLGYMTRAELPPPLANAAFSLKPGQVSEIVESKAGYDIIKIRDRRDAVVTPYEKAKPEIEGYLKSLKSNASLEEYLKGVREKAAIEILLK